MTDSEMRPTPVLDDPSGVQRRLEQWLNETHYNGQPCQVSELVIPEDTGMSNITVMFEITESNGERQPMVGRLQAQGEHLAFPTYDLPMQYAAMRALANIEGLQVPELVALEPTGDVLDTPFYLMRRTAGLIPPDIPPYHMDGWIVASSAKERTTLWRSGLEMMAKLHRAPIDADPLQGFLADHKVAANLSEQLQYWVDYRDWGLAGRDSDISLRASEWLVGALPADTNLRLCWGDSRMANVIYREDKSDVAALLDWEMLAVGDPVQDLAWWIYLDELFSFGLGVERLAGFPDRAETAEIWSRASGLPADNLHYYLVFAGWRMALILARMSLASGDGSMVEGGFAWDYLAKVLAEQA